LHNGDCFWTIAARSAGAIVVVIFVVLTVRRAEAADQILLLEVVINGFDTGKIGEFVLRDGALFARREELTDLGFRVPEDVTKTGDGMVALSTLPGLTSHLDQPTQTLIVTATADRLLPQQLRTNAPAAGSYHVESGTGATLNYDLTGMYSSHNIAIGQLDLRIFSPWGVASSTALVYAGESPSGANMAIIRLDSSYVYSDPDAGRRYHLGDFITGGLTWTRPVRLGGAQITADFSMRPDLVTFPLPVVSGTVAVPSTVDVLVNSTKLLSQQVPPGPFQVSQIPVVSGAGTITMKVTNVLGQQITTVLPYYTSANLLAPGLQTYTVEIGRVRRNYGMVSNDYGNLAGFATYRRGIATNLTLETHAEGTAHQYMVGGGLVINLFDFGVANVSAADSAGAGKPGAQISFGMQRLGRVFSFGANASFANHNFRDVAAMSGDPVPRRQISANAGLSLGRYGSFGLAYADIDRDVTPEPISYFVPGSYAPSSSSVPGGVTSFANGVISFTPAMRTHLLTASYSAQAHGIALYASGFHDLVHNGSGTGILFGITIPLGARSSISAAADFASANSQQIQAQQSVVSIGDWGYQAYANRDNSDHEFGELQYKSPWSLVSVGADHIDQQTTFRTEAQGAFSFVDGSLFASNTINDSFAIVDTNGMPGVHVLEENRPIGITGSDGKLLVPDLRSFDTNHLAIDPTDVPVDAVVPYVSRDVRPQDRSGAVVKFPIHASHGALLVLVDKSGKPLPLGSSATLQASGATVPVGYDGEAFVEDLGNTNRLAVQFPSGQRCIVIFQYHPVAGKIPTIGPLTCVNDKP
jgi:outer membrane usher protein